MGTVIVISIVLLIIGFGNVAMLLDYLENTLFFGFLKSFPHNIRNLAVLMLLIYALKEHKRVAEWLAGVLP